MAEDFFDDAPDEETEDDSELPSDPALEEVLAHMASLGGKIPMESMDFLLAKIAEKDAKLKALELETKRHNKVMARIKAIAIGVLKDLDRESCEGPHGKLKIDHMLQTRMPQTPEKKAELWAWMREKGIYDRYATVQSNSLKSLFKAEMEIASESPDYDPVTFALPGMEPAKFYDKLTFKPKKP